MSLGRFSQSLDKARQDKKLNRSRLAASACLLGVTLSAAGCSAPAVNAAGPPPPDVRETPTPHYGGGSGGGGGGGTT
jgi:hypothetical protein